VNKTLVLFAHPYFEHSKANIKLTKVYQNKEYVTFRDLYEEYPDFSIETFKERKRLPAYDRIIFHMPLIWFGMPPLLKLWIDEVFETRWVIHHGKNSPLAGKKACIIVTAGGSAQSFSEEGFFKLNAKRYLSSLIESIGINNMSLEKFIAIYDADQLSQEEISRYYDEIKEIIEKT